MEKFIVWIGMIIAWRIQKWTMGKWRCHSHGHWRGGSHRAVGGGENSEFTAEISREHLLYV